MDVIWTRQFSDLSVFHAALADGVQLKVLMRYSEESEGLPNFCLMSPVFQDLAQRSGVL